MNKAHAAIVFGGLATVLAGCATTTGWHGRTAAAPPPPAMAPAGGGWQAYETQAPPPPPPMAGPAASGPAMPEAAALPVRKR